jgi:hypothetical protein
MTRIGSHGAGMAAAACTTAGATANHFGTLRFSSTDLPLADRVPFYCDVMGRMLAKVNVEPVDENFSCHARLSRFPDLSISSVVSSAIRGTRTREMAEGDPD